MNIQMRFEQIQHQWICKCIINILINIMGWRKNFFLTKFEEWAEISMDEKENYVFDMCNWEWYVIEEEMSWKLLHTIYMGRVTEGTLSLYENITNKKTQVPVIHLHVSKSGPPMSVTIVLLGYMVKFLPL